MGLEGTILLVGAPASGKTTLCMELSRKLGCKCVSVSELARREGLILEYDDMRDTWVLDVERVRDRIKELLSEDRCLVVETIDPSAVPGPHVVGIAVRCPPRKLKRRLESRGYKDVKVWENLEYEAVDGPLYDLLRVMDLDKVIEVNGCSEDLRGEIEYVLNKMRYEGEFEKRFNWTDEFMGML